MSGPVDTVVSMAELPRISLTAESLATDAVTVLYVRSVDDAPVLLAPADIDVPAESLVALGVTGATGQTQRILVADESGEPRPVLLVGLGSSDPADAETLRRAAGTAARALSRAERVVHALPEATPGQVGALALGHLLGGYEFREFVTEGHASATTDVLVLGDEAAEQALNEAVILAESVAIVRDLGNWPPSDLTPEDFADRALDIADSASVHVEIWDEQRLAEEGCGGILGVGQGSSNPPRLVLLDYSPESPDAHVALVGKGITFDTGGLSLKPSGSMLHMKFDMCGAAAVLGTIVAAARLDIPVRITGYLCLAENMPSGDAIKPDDVLRMRNGLTVEVTNTDAEGRLVLADGLALASEQSPNLIIDIATLTGAALVALGERTMGVMGNDPVLQQDLVGAARSAGEPAETLSIPEEIPERLSSPVADLVNATPKDRSGGMLLAAAFLERFIGKDASAEPLPWIHLDIAGPAQNLSSARDYTPKGATGVPVRTLIELIRGLQR